EPADAGLVAERLAERRAERQRGVLHGVVGVDVQVALGPHGQVEQPVLGELVEHVVVEADAGGDVGDPGPVEVDLDQDLGLLGGAFDAAGAAHGGGVLRWWLGWVGAAGRLSPGGRRGRGARPGSGGHPVTWSNASRKADISSGVPMVVRSHAGGPTSRISTPRSSMPRKTAVRSGNSPNMTKFASESATRKPCPRSQSTRASRSSRSCLTPPRSSSEKSRAT